MGQQTYNFSPIRGDEATSLVMLLALVNKQLLRLASVLHGPQLYQAPAIVSTARTLNPAIADITTLELTDDVTITLDMVKTRTGSEGKLELRQDAVGGRAVTWENALTTPTIDATAERRTLLLVVRSTDGWVLTTLASGY